jgi:hypothetical protein
MKLGATEVVITKNKGFEERHVGQLDLIIVCDLRNFMMDAEPDGFISALQTFWRAFRSRK